MDGVTVRMDPSGRLVIPRDMREALGVPDGGELRLALVDGELRATTRLAALRRIQAEARQVASAGRLASDTLIADRRAEAARGLHEEQAPWPAPSPRHGEDG